MKKHLKKVLLAFGLTLVAYWFCLPNPLFDTPSCVVLEDRNGNLLGARIAADEQWRFPSQGEVPQKFAQAIIEFEDRRFFFHPGIDPIGIGRAILQNIRNRRIVSGGSTLTMQVIRLARPRKPRTIFQKIVEIIQATRLELTYSKAEILRFYASYAPFGGNVVGLDAASWRYYGKRPALLSWAEVATLAVLPNSPALIHPGRNRQALLDKRNRLLDRLFKKGAIDQLTLELAKAEILPDQPLPLPRLAPHLLDKVSLEFEKKGGLTRLKTTIHRNLQRQSTRILQKHQQVFQANGIYNAAAIILEVETGDVLAYVGNVLGAGEEHGEQVDIIKAPRSTGSILKPFLYAGALQEGQLLPNSLIADIPTQMQGYRPENYYAVYDGVVPAKRALIRSLNVPFVRILQEYGLEKFHFLLNELGLTTIFRPANHYGLPLILGGAEGTLWDIANAYTCMARTLNHFQELDGQYDPDDFRPPNYIFKNKNLESELVRSPGLGQKLLKQAPKLSAAAIYQTFDAMQRVERPDTEGNWDYFRSSQQIAWKTGTSIGFRDAWAIGATPKYAVGVWVGNADGEGRRGLVGVEAAAPILFDLFDLLPAADWFFPPYDEMKKIAVCRKSGYRALDICETDTVWVTISGEKVKSCPFHRLIHLDKSREFRVNSACESPLNMVHQPWFVLPPIEEHYYRFRDPGYKTLPEYRADCQHFALEADHPMRLIYPKKASKIYVPIDLTGELSRTIFKVAHRNPESKIYWHLDNTYLGSTQSFHDMALNPPTGEHLLTLVDEKGFRLERRFEIIGKTAIE